MVRIRQTENALPSFLRTDQILSVQCHILITNVFKLGVDSMSQNQPTTSEESPKALIDNQSLGTKPRGQQGQVQPKAHRTDQGPTLKRGLIPSTQMGPPGDSLIVV